MAHLVKVVIPIYKKEMGNLERASLDNTMKVLSAYPIVFLKPMELNLSELIEAYPQAEIVGVTSEWLGTKKGVIGYNEMMMSKGFYDLFSDTQYVLICHLDAWIFRDELSQWCNDGYDLVAPPWPIRPRYTHFPLKQLLQLQRTFSKGITRSHMYGRIGNGGLTLRKVSAFAAACEVYAEDITYFLSRQDDGLYYEDIFWALIPQKFNYPTVETALKFAYDLKPKLCYNLGNHQLPMGCHGFMRRSRVGFWKQFIPSLLD